MTGGKPGVFIIAEAGVNHNGSLDLALQMIDVAVECGADAVKFQTFKSENEISAYAPKAEYQKVTSGESESLLEMAKRLELDEDAHHRLVAYCAEKNIMFLSSPFERWSVDFVARLGVKIIKIPSGQVDNLPYLRQVGALGLPLILSTGMATMDEVRAALDVLVQAGAKRDEITVLHCTTAYPTPFEDVNLRAMLTMRDELAVRVGYSDHTPGIEVPVAAVAMGAEVIEKHFTLDKTMEGPDQAASIDRDELKAMVTAIRHIEQALGDGVKSAAPSEVVNTPIARRSIVAARPIKKGEVIREDMITVKSPANGLSPMLWDSVIGQTAKRDFEPDRPIEL
jgi:N,N'-diacetyllegionaminate synthase